MAHYQNQYGAVPQPHGYDDPDRLTDEHGNPVHHASTTGGYATGGFDSTTATGVLGHGGSPKAGTGIGGGYHEQGHRGLHRSGSSSSSSSSSEDDGLGGRRKKKGLKEKIKEKLPGVGHKDDKIHTSATTTSVGYGVPGEGRYQQQHHEKKGMMDKIKEKLPGHHH